MSGHRWRHSWDEPFETGLVVAVPEAVDRVAPVRDAFDPYARIGVPPHVTVLYPFVPPDRLSDAVIADVADVASTIPRFDFELVRVESFDDSTVYLAPAPVEPFVSMTRAFWERFPEHPPYGGGSDVIVPHLTVAAVPLGATREAVEEILASELPIPATASAVTVMVEDEDGWTVGAEPPLRDEVATR
jgi:2'-5' RNA ligase